MFCGDVKFGLVWCSGVDDGAPGGSGSGSASTPVAYESVRALATALSQARLPRSYLAPGWIVYFRDNFTTTQQQFPAAEHTSTLSQKQLNRKIVFEYQPRTKPRYITNYNTTKHNQTQWRQHAQVLLARRAAILRAKAQSENQSPAKDLRFHKSKH